MVLFVGQSYAKVGAVKKKTLKLLQLLVGSQTSRYSFTALDVYGWTGL